MKKLEFYVLILTAFLSIFTSYKIGEMNGRIQGIDRAIEIVEG